MALPCQLMEKSPCEVMDLVRELVCHVVRNGSDRPRVWSLTQLLLFAFVKETTDFPGGQIRSGKLFFPSVPPSNSLVSTCILEGLYELTSSFRGPPPSLMLSSGASEIKGHQVLAQRPGKGRDPQANLESVFVGKHFIPILDSEKFKEY